MVGPLVAAGHRVVVPDLVGFGRSDKPTTTTDYTYARHVDWMHQLLIGRLDLSSITFFGQDWGGLVGLRVLAAEPQRFARVVVANTGLPTGAGRASKAFLAWQQYSQTADPFEIGNLVNAGCARQLSQAEIAAYDAPFPDDTFKAAARIFPTLVPTAADDPGGIANAAAWEVLSRFERPWLSAFSDSDPITAGGDKPFREQIPGAQGQQHATIAGAAHFLQEDAPSELAAGDRPVHRRQPLTASRPAARRPQLIRRRRAIRTAAMPPRTRSTPSWMSRPNCRTPSLAGCRAGRCPSSAARGRPRSHPPSPPRCPGWGPGCSS